MAESHCLAPDSWQPSACSPVSGGSSEDMRAESTLRFPARDLKPYGEYVRSEDLIVGEVYFRVDFVDDDMLVPEVVPVVFVGRNLTPGDDSRSSALLYFQDFDSYSAGIRYETIRAGSQKGADQSLEDVDEPPSFECAEETEYSGVFEFEKALDQLLTCSLRRKPCSEA